MVDTLPAQLRARDGTRYADYMAKKPPEHAAKHPEPYSETHVLLLSFRVYFIPIIVRETMAHGAPAAAVDAGGIGGILEHFELGAPLFGSPN